MEPKQNISQGEMASFMKESQQYISLLIKNKIHPRLNRLEKFAKQTNTDLAFWLTSSGEEKEHVIKEAISDQSEEAA